MNRMKVAIFDIHAEGNLLKSVSTLKLKPNHANNSNCKANHNINTMKCRKSKQFTQDRNDITFSIVTCYFTGFDRFLYMTAIPIKLNAKSLYKLKSPNG